MKLLLSALSVFVSLFAIAFVFPVLACSSSKAALYTVTLQECNRNSNSLCDSIACENHARAANGRPLRSVPASCGMNDAGVSHD